MPHVSVKLYPGRSDDQKRALAAALTEAVVATVGSGRDSISVSVEDVSPQDWTTRVYETEIAARPEHLYKRPGYGPLK